MFQMFLTTRRNNVLLFLFGEAIFALYTHAALAADGAARHAAKFPHDVSAAFRQRYWPAASSRRVLRLFLRLAATQLF